MRRVTLLVVASCSGLLPFLTSTASATMNRFQPTPVDLWELDHNQYYTWGIQWTPKATERVERVTLSINDINDWHVEAGDILYVHLLDNPKLGAKKWTDNEGGGDAFKNNGLLLTTYTDDDRAPNPAEDWSYSLTRPQIDALISYAANGVVGFGFDPDCHYYNKGVTLEIETMPAQVPEPATAVMLLTAAAGVLFRRRRA